MRKIIYTSICLTGFLIGNALAVLPANQDELHLSWIDKSVSPSQNFYEYANGTWAKHNMIPAAYSSWGVLDQLEVRNDNIIHGILEEAAKNPHNIPNSDTQKVGDLYYSGMDMASINRLGAKPLHAEFDRLNRVSNLMDLQNEIAHLQSIGVGAIFGLGEMQDFKNSNNVIGIADQGGLSLPDRDYYLNPDPKFAKIRQAYVQHVAKVFQMLGDNQQQAAQEAQTVMAIETKLAQVSLTRIQQRDPKTIYHIMTVAQLQQWMPNFSWQMYLTNMGVPHLQSLNLASPGFFQAVNGFLQTVSLNDWKTYLRWQLISAFADYLSQNFVDEDFRMSAVLSGAKKILPRWQLVVAEENDALGFAVGKLYVQKTFSPQAKQQVIEMLTNIRAQLRKDLETLSWMSPATRQAAIQKLDMMGARIGYPDRWRDYSALKIDRGPYVLNVMRANIFDNQRELNKIGKPVDRNEWDMTPQTVNAYYDPSMNNLNVTAGILQPPLFSANAPAAMNYGGIGFVMGHEMTHGFDDQGSQFDGHGNLKNWWTSDDLQRFHNATNCIITQFSTYTVNGTSHVQGKLVVGEATADLGGLTLSYRAFHDSAAYQMAKTIAGFTPDQQFFLAAAHVWATNVRPQQAEESVLTDPHPPAMYRVNGTVSNMPQFQQAFNLPNNAAMVNQVRCVIW